MHNAKKIALYLVVLVVSMVGLAWIATIALKSYYKF